MNRVHKKFLYKISKPLVAITIIIAISAIISLVTQLPFPVALVFLMCIIAIIAIIAMIVDLAKDVYMDCKEEVDRENREMLNTIKGRR